MRVEKRPGPNVNQVQDKAQVKSNEVNKPASSASAHVEVSSLSRTLSEARTQPEAPDQAKVAQLSQSIRAGSFKVDHEHVADTMVREEV